MSDAPCGHRPFIDEAVLDGLDVGLVMIDASGRIAHANRAALDMLRATELVGQDPSLWLGVPDDLSERVAEEPIDLAFLHETPSGLELDLELTVGRARFPGRGEPDGYYVAFRDVHEAKHREAARRRFEHLAAMGTMVAGFAHEVRNPVAALRSIAEELTEDLAANDLSLPHPGRMLRILERIERLVRTSLQFGRPAAPRRAPHRPWTICSGALGGVAPRTMTAGQPIRVEHEHDLPDVFVDHGQLVQTLVILLENALDAATSPRGVLLRVTRARSRDVEAKPRRNTEPPAFSAVRFDVIDDGVGVPAAAESQIFDPFFTTKAAGTGLGLSIAQQLVAENGGRLVLASPRSPTIFSVLAPAAEDGE